MNSASQNPSWFFQNLLGSAMLTPDETWKNIQNAQPGFPTAEQNKEIAEKASRESLKKLGESIKSARDSDAVKTVVDAALITASDYTEGMSQQAGAVTWAMPASSKITFSPQIVGPALGWTLFSAASALAIVQGINKIDEVAHKRAAESHRPLQDAYADDSAVRDEYIKQLVVTTSGMTISGGLSMAGMNPVFNAALTMASMEVMNRNYPSMMTGTQNGLANAELIPDIISQQVHLLKEDFGATLDEIHATTPKSIYESLTPQSAEKVSQFLHGINGFIGDAIDLKNSPEGLSADRLKSLVDYHVHQITGSEGVCPAHPLGELDIGSSPMNRKLPTFIDNIIEPVPQTITPLQFGPKGEELFKVLPSSHRSMAPGADEMGSRSEIKRIAVERTGLAANDPRNDIQTLLNENKWRPMGHMLILADGTVQGPEQGAIPFENNPRIAAGKNGETLGVMYAGQGSMNDAQASTFAQVTDSLKQMRAQEGLPKDIEIIAGSTSTAEILNLPTPRGPLQSTESPQTAPQLQRRQSNSLGGI